MRTFKCLWRKNGFHILIKGAFTRLLFENVVTEKTLL